MKYVTLALAAIGAFFAAMFARRSAQLEEAKVENLTEKSRAQDQAAAQEIKVADSRITTAKENYEKALSDLPPDYKPPGGS